MHVILWFAFTPIWKRLTQRAKSLRGGRGCQGGGRSGLKVWDQGGSHRRQTSHQIWSEKSHLDYFSVQNIWLEIVSLSFFDVYLNTALHARIEGAQTWQVGGRGGSHIDYEARTAPTFPYIAMPGRFFLLDTLMQGRCANTFLFRTFH